MKKTLFTKITMAMTAVMLASGTGWGQISWECGADYGTIKIN
jgi:hypothetical protein